MNLVRYVDDGARVGLLAKETDTYSHIVTIHADGLRSIKLPSDDDTAFTYLDGDSEVVRQKFISIGKLRGCTVRAAELLDDKDLIELARQQDSEST